MSVHPGSCQCGAVAFEAEVDVSRPLVCNCSRCRRLGSRLAFATPDGFRLLRGEGALTEYRFNSGVIRHQFCATCGIEPFAFGRTPDGRDVVAINVNCLDDVDPLALPTQFHDGRSA
ncbi:GFA family protein [Amaricoccus sp.]|uniref:GFA family protein n=1 Tax=Amaricoccus sp. TaxID=1872485 RepID=UPI001B6702B3|nr:GFA family protein [Amaricoccus sp.]MBP7240903.1 GFA family protein [Amaricoccus sp.]